MRYIFALVAIIASLSLVAQKNYTISGHVQDAVSGEQLIGATIYSKELKQGVGSNIYGFYSLTIPEGNNLNLYVTPSITSVCPALCPP